MPDEPYKPADNGFINMIQEQRGGLLEEELDAEVKKIVQLLRVRGGTGKVSLTFTIKELAEYEGCVTVLDDIKVTHPKKKEKAELRFMDKDGGLVSDKPEQEQLFPTGEKTDHKPGGLSKTTDNVSPIGK